MPFDQPTRNALAKMVGDCRRLLTEDVRKQLQGTYGLQPDGAALPLDALGHVNEQGREIACELREWQGHLAANEVGSETKRRAAAFERMAREMSFTVLNRLAALRLCEEREHVIESVRRGMASDGFQLFERLSGGALGSRGEIYRVFLDRMFDELALDLGALFDRRDPRSLVFPGEQCLEQVLALLTAQALSHLWQEDETIGWIYQYFNDPAERKQMREKSAAPRDSYELAVRNQFFTPRYVVEFLTDNTLGRVWYEMTCGETRLRDRCRYLVRRPNEIFLKQGESVPAEDAKAGEGLSQEELLKQPVHIPHRPLKDPRTILMVDPACGSMHFGLYAFDLFEVIYDEAWKLEEQLGTDALSRQPGIKPLHDTYAAKDALLTDVPRLIIEHNIHGIDIDPRCAQIAGLSLWLRAQKAWQRLGLKPAERPAIKRSNVVCAEPMPGEDKLLREFIARLQPRLLGQLVEAAFEKMKLAGEVGSLLKIEDELRGAIAAAKKQWLRSSRAEQLALFPEQQRRKAEQMSLFDLSGISEAEFWEDAEDRVLEQLRRYAEQVDNGSGYRRRLFADDAAHGFAFIDVCRKRYDVALMNPPFGVCSSSSLQYIREAYPVGYIDLYTSFIDRGHNLNCTSGLLGAITSRTAFFLSSFERWRRGRLLGDTQIGRCIDLGQGVLDGAMVETAAYTIQQPAESHSMLFVDLTFAGDKKAALDESLAGLSRNVFVCATDELLQTPSATIAYAMPSELAEDFQSLPPVSRNGTICRGSATSDDERFIRTIWEVPPAELKASSERRWRWLSKGGEFGAFYAPIHLALDWKRDGDYLGEFMYLKRPRNGYLWGPHSWSCEFIGKPGVVWPLRSQKGLSFRALPPDCAFSHKSPAVMSSDTSTDFALLAILNTQRVQALADCLTTFGSYEMGVVGSIPIDLSNIECFSALGREGFEAVRTAFSLLEIDPNHTLLCGRRTTGIDSLLDALSTEIRSCELMLGKVIERANEIYRGGTTETDSRHEAALSSIREELTCYAILSELLGCAFGRWDIRYVTGEKAAPDLPEPFAPLPVCPPGMLQNAAGLPLTREDENRQKAGGRWQYPIEIPWGGILVDDPNHPLDIERRVRGVIEIIWKDRAEAIEHEACEILGVKSLRDYFRKPTGFFADHLNRYSKSRRQAPIYWPLSTPSGSYTLWIYYHRLTDQTLYACVNDFVQPKLNDLERDIPRLRDEKRTRDLQAAVALQSELEEFKQELLAWAPRWKPNLNDGVLITACPLRKLFRLPKWRKDLEACWKELEAGDYDWAHLAYSLWPDRVREKCKKDRSLAIAHGLEEICEVPPPKAKTGRRGRRSKNEAAPQMELGSNGDSEEADA